MANERNLQKPNNSVQKTPTAVEKWTISLRVQQFVNPLIQHCMLHLPLEQLHGGSYGRATRIELLLRKLQILLQVCVIISTTELFTFKLWCHKYSIQSKVRAQKRINVEFNEIILLGRLTSNNASCPGRHTVKWNWFAITMHHIDNAQFLIEPNC